jgi:transposase-like protein
MIVVHLPHSQATDDAPRPKVLHTNRRHAPKKAPCPHCGRLGRRKDFQERTVRSIAYQAIHIVHVTTAEYRATCDCCTTFRTQVEGIEPKAHYDNKVREAVLDRLLDDRMSLTQIRHALRRDFFLELSEGFLADCLDWKTRQFDGAAYRQWTLAHFSGTLCVDEIHLGPHTLLLATDPLNDFPVAFALVKTNDQEHMGRFLRQLRDHGLTPRVVVTDGSPLYPALLAQLWPQAEHQLCVFHVLRDLNKEVLKAVRRIGRALQRRGKRGSKRKRGRRAKGARRWQSRAKHKGKAHLVIKKSYLIVKRRDRLTAGEQKELARLLEYAPALRVLRSFVDEVGRLFESSQSEAVAWRRHAALLAEPSYTAVPELAAALGMLRAEKFAKMIAFLRTGAGRRVRTNNHVERMNRVLRLYEKARYKWRGSRTKVRFVCLLIDRRWGKQVRRWLSGGGAARPAPGAGQQPVGPEGGDPPRQQATAA